MDIKIDPEQFNKIIKDKEPSRSFPYEKLFTFLQSLAIILGAGWAIFNYLNYEKQSNELALKNSNLDTQIKEMEAESKKNELETSKQIQFSLSANSTITKLYDYNDSEALYQCRYFVKGENKSKNAIEISSTFMEVFTTDTFCSKRGFKNNIATQIPFVPPYYKPDDAIHPWKRTFSKGYRIDDSSSYMQLIAHSKDFVTYETAHGKVDKGGGCGSYNPGQPMGTDYKFLIRCKENLLVGFKFYVLLDGGADNKHIQNVNTAILILGVTK